MNHFFESIINLFFPPKCPFCGKVLDAVGVCSKCEKDLPWLPEEGGGLHGEGPDLRRPALV